MHQKRKDAKEATVDVGTSPLSSAKNPHIPPQIDTTDQDMDKNENLRETRPQKKTRRRIAKIEEDSWFAAILTSFEYVGNDLRKKQK